MLGNGADVLPPRRNVLSGSYNNYFHIYDTDATQDIVLQADKSAFKAKKIGGKNSKGAGAGGAGAAGGKGGKNGKPIVDTENIDYNKKILHASWHPREDTVSTHDSSWGWWFLPILLSRLVQSYPDRSAPRDRGLEFQQRLTQIRVRCACPCPARNRSRSRLPTTCSSSPSPASRRLRPRPAVARLQAVERPR